MPERLLHFEIIRRGLSFYRRWISMVVLSAALLGVVGYASDETIGLFYVSLTAVIFLVTTFHAVFGNRSAFFNIVFANVITIYLCFFTFFVESLFRGVGWGYIAVGFLLPLVSFLGGAVRQKKEIFEIIESQQYVKEHEFARSFLWLIPIALVGVCAFILHMEYANVDDAPALADAAQAHLAASFLMEMTAIATIVFFASRDFTLMLVDTGMLFSDFFVSNARLIKPAFAFFTFYSLNIIVFSAIYKIIDKLSDVHHFVIRGAARHLSFVEAMYFSLVTVSTLGYGDIVPVTNPIRFIVGIQTFLGTMLFFFGVHAIIGHTGNQTSPERKDDAPKA